MFLSITDVIIVVLAVLLVVSIIYFHYWKNRKDPCKGCPYAKACEKKEDCNKK